MPQRSQIMYATNPSVLNLMSPRKSIFSLIAPGLASKIGKTLTTVRKAVIAVVLIWMMMLGEFSSSALAEDFNKAFLIGEDFSGKVLIDSSFTKSNLRDANFSKADLRGVSFFGANLERANLEGANLSNSTLDAARLTNANLTNAILEGAFAFNAKFDGATIEGTDFTDVEVRPDALAVLCKSAVGTNPTTGRKTRETLYCD
jgi:uncharacterized protein YjbI with pentapeptide repeats